MPLPPAYLVKTSSAATYTALYIWKWNQTDGPEPPLGDYELRPLSEVPVGTAWSATEQTQWFYTAGRRLILPASGDASRSVERIYTGTGLIGCIAPFPVTRDVMAAIEEGGRVIRVGGTVTAPTLTLMPAGTPIDTGSTETAGPTGPTGPTDPTDPTDPTGSPVSAVWSDQFYFTIQSRPPMAPDSAPLEVTVTPLFNSLFAAGEQTQDVLWRYGPGASENPIRSVLVKDATTGVAVTYSGLKRLIDSGEPLVISMTVETNSGREFVIGTAASVSGGPGTGTGTEADTGVIGTWNNWRGTSTSAMKAGDISYLSSGAAIRFHPTDSAGVDHDAEIHTWRSGDVITLTQGTKVATVTLTGTPNPTSTTSTTQYIQVPTSTASVTGTPLSGFVSGQPVTVAKPPAAAGGIKKVHAGGNAVAAKILAGSVAARKIYAGSTLVWEA